MGLRRTKMDENSEYASGRVASEHSLSPQSSALSTIFVGAIDEDVWDAAQSEGRFLITQDLDFSDIHKFAPGTHYGILLLRLNSPLRTTLIRYVYTLFQTENVTSWTGCLIVASDRKVRIRRP